MGYRCVLFAALLALVHSGPTVAASHDATPDPAAACTTIASRSLDALLALWYEPSGTPVASPPPSLQVAEEADFPPGEPADAATVTAIDAVAQQWAACQNAGDLVGVYALYTDHLAQLHGFQAFLPREEAGAILAEQVPLPPEFAWAIGPPRQVRVLPDGRVAAVFIGEWGGTAQNIFAIFAHLDSGWRLDKLFYSVAMDPRAPVGGYRVKAEFPHDDDAYTQGLVFIDDTIYEGTGLYGESTLRRVSLETGAVAQSVSLDPSHFGEGIAVVDDRIFQLTWQTGTCFVYDRETFAVLETFTYQTEGWGLTWDGERLVMSDGSNRLVLRDPATFEALGAVDVWDGDVPVSNLNELEYVNGEVWANVYQTDRIARINPATGDVTGWIDLTGLLPPEVETADVLNGIAYDPESGRLFVTGKLWPALYEIELVPPP
jgi:glutamine cyclotransferase